jgi:uncharacterized repeat protein (TIGR01451 family)
MACWLALWARSPAPAAAAWGSSWPRPPAPSVVQPRLAASLDASGGGVVFAAVPGRGVFSTGTAFVDWQPQAFGAFDSGIVAADPLDSRYVYQEAAVSGVAMAYRSSDGGLSWTPAGGPPNVTAIAVAPGSGGKVAYVLATSGSLGHSVIERTTDAGAHWAQLPDPYPNGTTDIAVDPTNGALYANTFHALYRSADGSGSDWAPLAAHPLDCGGHALIQVLPTTPRAIYLGCNSLWRSTDDGVSWTNVQSAVPTGSQTIQALAIDPSGRTIVVGYYESTYASTDGGQTFTHDPGYDSLDSLVVDPSDPMVVFATRTTFPYVVESRDGGLTWGDASAGMSTYRAYSPALDPFAPSTVWMAASEIGVQRSTDAGASWSAAGALGRDALTILPDPAAAGRLYAGTFAGVETSTDGGATWTLSPLDHGEIDALAANAQRPGMVFAGDYLGGLYRSVDAGSSWQPIGSSLPDLVINAIVIDPAQPDTIWIGTMKSGVWKSIDDGSHWTATGLASGWVNALALDPSRPSTIYAGTCGDPSTNVLRSDDGGITWQPAGTGLPAHCINGIAVDPAAPQLVYVTSGGLGAFASDDGAQSWYPLSDGLLDGVLYGLVSETDGTALFAGSRAGGLEYGFDADLWSELSVNTAVAHPADPVTYTASIGNDGPDDATGVTATLTLPPGASAPPPSHAPGIDCTGGQTIVCSLGTLAPGTGYRLTVSAPAPATPGVATATADVSGGRHDPTSGDTHASVNVTISSAPVTTARDTSPPSDLRIGGPGRADPLSHPFQTRDRVALRWSARDPGSAVADYDLRVRTAGRTGSFGGYRLWRRATTHAQGTYNATPGDTVCFSLRATDKAGNQSPWTPDRCTAFPLPAIALRRSGDWSLAPASGRSSAALTADRRGARLTLAGVGTRQLAVIADRCPTCGTLAVSLAGRHVATIPLTAARTTSSQLIVFGRFATLRRGVLTLTATGRGRPVRVRAIGLSAAAPEDARHMAG